MIIFKTFNEEAIVIIVPSGVWKHMFRIARYTAESPFHWLHIGSTFKRLSCSTCGIEWSESYHSVWLMKPCCHSSGYHLKAKEITSLVVTEWKYSPNYFLRKKLWSCLVMRFWSIFFKAATMSLIQAPYDDHRENCSFPNIDLCSL